MVKFTHFRFYDNTVITLAVKLNYYDVKRTMQIGYSVKHKDDQFVKKIGNELALERMEFIEYDVPDQYVTHLELKVWSGMILLYILNQSQERLKGYAYEQRGRLCTMLEDVLFQDIKKLYPSYIVCSRLQVLSRLMNRYGATQTVNIMETLFTDYPEDNDEQTKL